MIAMPRSFLVKSQGFREKERRRGLGIAKLVYDPTRAATVITTLVRPEPRRPVITYVQATLPPPPRCHPWEPRSVATSCGPVVPRSYIASGSTEPDSSASLPPTKPFFRPFLPLPPPQMRSFFPTPPPLVTSPTGFPGVDESRLPSPGSDGGETYQEKKPFDRRMPSRKPAQKLKCPDCGKEYCTTGGLIKHQQTQCSAGQNGRSFKCKYCAKEYTALGALKMHLRTHTLPCKCTICGKAFSRPWLLQGHIRTHTGEKPFSCAHCQRAFADRSNLRAHLQTHSHVKRYSCALCTKTFSRMSLLNKHNKSGCDSSRGKVALQAPPTPSASAGGNIQVVALST